MGAKLASLPRKSGEYRLAWKLLRVRKDGTLGPLFINRRLVIQTGKWLRAEDHPTKGYKHRPGWHAAPTPTAPHLSQRGRVWCAVILKDWMKISRPAAQGGEWYLAERMLVVAPCEEQAAA